MELQAVRDKQPSCAFERSEKKYMLSGDVTKRAPQFLDTMLLSRSSRPPGGTRGGENLEAVF